MEALERAIEPETNEAQAKPAETGNAGAEGTPAISLAGLTFFVVDAVAKQLIWMEPEGLDFEGGAGLKEAPLSSALRRLSQGDQKQVLSLIQRAMHKGKAGPIDLGGDDIGHGLSLSARRYETSGGGAMVIAAADGDGIAETGGAAVRGVAPLIRHLVEGSSKSVLVVDSFGYVRYANDHFFRMFQIADPQFCIGRNIAHIPNRLGKTLPSLILTGLARRAPEHAARRFLLSSGDAVSLSFSLVPFRVSAGLGGAVFTAERQLADGVDFQRVMDLLVTSVIVVDAKTRMMVAANDAARRAFAMSQQMMESAPITETLLHPKTYKTLIDHAQQGSQSPVQATINGFDGVTRSKRLKATLMHQDESIYLVIESKH